MGTDRRLARVYGSQGQQEYSSEVQQPPHGTMHPRPSACAPLYAQMAQMLPGLPLCKQVLGAGGSSTLRDKMSDNGVARTPFPLDSHVQIFALVERGSLTGTRPDKAALERFSLRFGPPGGSAPLRPGAPVRPVR